MSVKQIQWTMVMLNKRKWLRAQTVQAYYHYIREDKEDERVGGQ